jgi:nitrite reductase/ring-hydroxylating ferredoxin subunit
MFGEASYWSLLDLARRYARQSGNVAAWDAVCAHRSTLIERLREEGRLVMPVTRAFLDDPEGATSSDVRIRGAIAGMPPRLLGTAGFREVQTEDDLLWIACQIGRIGRGVGMLQKVKDEVRAGVRQGLVSTSQADRLGVPSDGQLPLMPLPDGT